MVCPSCTRPRPQPQRPKKPARPVAQQPTQEVAQQPAQPAKVQADTAPQQPNRASAQQEAQQQAAEPDPVVLSQLLDDTVQLLGHTSLIARQV